MSTTRLKCHGVSVGEWWVPSFELRDGECVTLVLPTGVVSAAEELTNRFTGRVVSPDIESNGKVVVATPASGPRGIRRWFADSSASGWLVRRGASREQAFNTLRRHNITPDNLASLAQNPRTLLGLEAAWAQGARVLIFATTGCDPLGVLMAFDAVSQHLPTCPAVYLSFPTISAGEASNKVFPGSTVVEVTRRSPIAV